MFVPRVTLPSLQGPVTVILDGDARLCAHDIVADDVNRKNIVLLRCCWLSLLADSPFDPIKPKAVILAFAKRLYHAKDTVIEFSALADDVMRSERIEEHGTVIRTYVPAMSRTPIFREYHYWWRTGDSRALQYILGFLKYGKKTSYMDASLHSNALVKWIEVENRLKDLKLPNFTENLRLVCHWLFRDFKLGALYPAHGGGAVAEFGVRGVNAKNAGLTLSNKVWTTYFKGSIFNYSETGDYGLPDFQGYSDQDFVQMARLMFVPKDLKTSRSICMEPIGFQFAQQGVLWYFEQYLKQSKIGRFVDLERQESNQEAAQFGSFTGLVDTIDLSSASDSVAWKLIQRIMPANLLRHLLATRSTQVRISDNLSVRPYKYAPMGSALCFPTQCCVFAAIVITIGFLQSLGRELDDPTALVGVDFDNLMDYSFGDMGSTSAGRFEAPQIYGDDICLDHRLVSNTMNALTALGFVVNREKSFTGNDTFRESCGKYYSRGRDVSFILHSVKPLDEERVTIDTLGSVIDLANRAHTFGYLKLRSTLINFALRHQFPGVSPGKQGLNPVLFTENPDESFAIVTPVGNARNSHLRKRLFDSNHMLDVSGFQPNNVLQWVSTPEGLVPPSIKRKAFVIPSSRLTTSVLFQRDEVKSITSVPCRDVAWDDDYANYAYTVWWRSRRRKNDALRLSQSLARVDRLDTAAAYRWTGM